MTVKDFAEMHGTTPQAIRHYVAKGLIDAYHTERKGRRSPTINIVLSERTVKEMERRQIRKPITVKKSDAWIYRNDAMGQECSRPLETNNCGY